MHLTLLTIAVASFGVLLLLLQVGAESSFLASNTTFSAPTATPSSSQFSSSTTLSDIKPPAKAIIQAPARNSSYCSGCSIVGIVLGAFAGSFCSLSLLHFMLISAEESGYSGG
jgi:hypothetical protein